MKAMNNSSEYILALAANFSEKADGHLVCFQNTESGCTETRTYSTQAVNIQGRTRKGMNVSRIKISETQETTFSLCSHWCQLSRLERCVEIEQWPVW